MRWPCVALVSGILGAGPATAGPAWDWQQVLVAADARPGNALPFPRSAALLHVAMFDAGNAVARRYQPYRAVPELAAPASGEAAAAAAAHEVLARLYPPSRAEIDRRFEAALEAVAPGAARDNGVALGRRVAASLLDERESDGWTAPGTYREDPAPVPGRYRAAKPPIGSQFGRARPFFLARTDELRPPPPPALDSAEFLADLAEVRARGGRQSSVRSPEEARVARFIAVSHTRFHLNPLSAALARRELPWLEESRLMALAALASADAILASFEAKYHYLFWRPETAVGEGWQALVDTPPHPEYPCNHCVQGAVFGAFLDSGLVPGGLVLRYVNPAVSPDPIEISRGEDIVAMSIAGRVDGGLHYRFSAMAGATLGRAVARRAFSELLRPLP